MWNYFESVRKYDVHEAKVDEGMVITLSFNKTMADLTSKTWYHGNKKSPILKHLKSEAAQDSCSKSDTSLVKISWTAVKVFSKNPWDIC